MCAEESQTTIAIYDGTHLKKWNLSSIL